MTDPEDIRAWQRLSPRITTSGRIEDTDIPRLAAIGIKRVINLALDDHPEALADEAAKLAASGIGYIHIPIPFAAPTADHYHAFAAALACDDAPTHIHCIMNYRVSALFYIHHRLNGMDRPQAKALMHHHWSPDMADHPPARAWGELIENIMGAQA